MNFDQNGPPYSFIKLLNKWWLFFSLVLKWNKNLTLHLLQWNIFQQPRRIFQKVGPKTMYLNCWIWVNGVTGRDLLQFAWNASLLQHCFYLFSSEFTPIVKAPTRVSLTIIISKILFNIQLSLLDTFESNWTPFFKTIIQNVPLIIYWLTAVTLNLSYICCS